MQFQRKGAADWNARSPRVVARVRKTHLTLLESCLTCSNPIIKCNVRRNFLDLNGRKRIKVEKEKKVSSYVEPSIRPLAMVNFKSWLCSQRQRNLLEKCYGDRDARGVESCCFAPALFINRFGFRRIIGHE